MLLSNIDIIRLECVDSTNSEAKRRAKEGLFTPLLIIAEHQTGGRGRMGRSFFSPKGEGLYMSLVYTAEGNMTDAVKITSAAAVAVSRAVEKLSGLACRIKWVNDIYVDGRKVCGILTEAMTLGEKNVIVVGVGVNCTTEEFPDDIRDRAGTIGEVDKGVLAEEIARGILGFAGSDSSAWIDEYRQRSLVLGKEITYYKNGETHIAKATAIDDNGALVVEENGELTILFTGEITVRLN